VITTNYDRMFEAAFVGAGQTGIRYWVPPMLGPSHGDATLWQWNADADSNLRTVYKIHGTFGEPSDWSKTKLEDAIKDFHGWMQKQLANGTSNTVATGRVYEQIAFKIPNDRFEREYEPVLKILRNQENIVVCVGIGLGAEEHVISRLLSSRGDSFGPVLKLNTATPLELDPSELKGITSINLDLGLAAGSERRFIATACFLECIFRILGKSPSKADTFQQLRPGLGLEPGDVVADRRLGVVERAGRSSDGAVPGDRDEDPQPGHVQHRSTIDRLVAIAAFHQR